MLQECCICFDDITTGTRIMTCRRCSITLHLECALKCKGVCPVCRYSSQISLDEYHVRIGAAMTLQAVFRGRLVRAHI